MRTGNVPDLSRQLESGKQSRRTSPYPKFGPPALVSRGPYTLSGASKLSRGASPNLAALSQEPVGDAIGLPGVGKPFQI